MATTLIAQTTKNMKHTSFFESPILKTVPATEFSQHPLPDSTDRAQTLFLVCIETNKPVGYVTSSSHSIGQVECYEGKGGLSTIISVDDIRIIGIAGSRLQGNGWDVCLYDTTPANPSQPWKVTSLNKTTPASEQIIPTEVQTVTDQAMILGAGLATRFEPVSGDRTGYSKPGTPLIGNHSVIRVLAEQLKNQGIKRILINTYYKAESMKAGLEGIDGVTFYYIDEEKPSGTAGALRYMLDNPSEFEGALDTTQPLLILQGDAVTDAQYTPLLNAHQQHNALLSLGCMIKPDEDVNKFGIVATDQSGDDQQSGNIQMFLEKPSLAEAGSHRLANTGFYVFSPRAYALVQQVYHEIVNKTGACNVLDFAMDIFPKIQETATAEGLAFWAQMMSGYWSDIGNPTQYVQSVYDLYNSETALNVPTPAHEYIQQSVVYWPHTQRTLQQANWALDGKVIVAKAAQTIAPTA